MSGWHVERLGGGLGAWAMAWDHLNRRLNGGHPLLDSRFVDALLTHFGAGDEYLCAHRNGQGVDGLCLLRRKGPGRWESFLPDQAPLGPLLLADAAMLGTLVRDLPGSCLALDLLCVDPRFSPDAAAWPGPLRQSGHALTIDVDFSTGAAAYWAARPKKLIGNLNRYRRRAEAAGWVPRLVHHTAPGDLSAALQRYGALESAGWKGRAGTAVAADNPQGRFYLDVLTRFAASGEAAVHEYRFGERLAASRLTIAGPAMIVALKTAYDESLAEYAPGRLLLRDLLDEAFARGQTGSFEFYTNATPDQLAWASGQRPIVHRTLYRNRALHRIHALFSRWRGQAETAP